MMYCLLIFTFYFFYLIFTYIGVFLYIYKTKTDKLDYKYERVAKTKKYIENDEGMIMMILIPGISIVLVIGTFIYWIIKEIVKLILTVVLILFDKYL